MQELIMEEGLGPSKENQDPVLEAGRCQACLGTSQGWGHRLGSNATSYSSCSFQRQNTMVLKNFGSGARLPGFKSQIFHLPTGQS